MRRRTPRRLGVDDRMPAELREPPPLTHRIMEDLPVWRRWAADRRAWLRVADPERAGPKFDDDTALPWMLMFDRWGGMPPLIGGPAAADRQAALWARSRPDRARR